MSSEKTLLHNIRAWILRGWPIAPFLFLSKNMLVVMVLMPWFYALWCLPAFLVSVVVKPVDRPAAWLNAGGLLFAVLLLIGAAIGAVAMH